MIRRLQWLKISRCTYETLNCLICPTSARIISLIHPQNCNSLTVFSILLIIITIIIIHKSILSSQLYHDNSPGDVVVELASWIISPQSATRQLWQAGKCFWTSYGRVTRVVVNTSSSLIELQLQSWRLASVSCWPVQTNGNVTINGKLIEQVQHAKLLGVTLDCRHGRNTLITYSQL